MGAPFGRYCNACSKMVVPVRALNTHYESQTTMKSYHHRYVIVEMNKPTTLHGNGKPAGYSIRANTCNRNHTSPFYFSIPKVTKLNGQDW